MFNLQSRLKILVNAGYIVVLILCAGIVIQLQADSFARLPNLDSRLGIVPELLSRQSSLEL